MTDTAGQSSATLSHVFEVPGADPNLINEDLAPAKERKWGFGSMFAMWMCDIHSIGGYTFAAGLFALGLGALAVFAGLSIGIVIVFMLMNLSGYAGQKYGIPYPVLARISFGTVGSNVAALTRAIVAIAWYGIQTWLASRAVIILAVKIWPSVENLDQNNFLGESTLGWIAFFLMWLAQLALLRNGMETIRKFQDWAGPGVWVVMFVLTIYIVSKAGGLGAINFTLPGEEAQWGGFHAFLAAVSLTVSYFAALLLNFCDFSRNAPTKKSVFWANAWGLPVNFIAFSVVSVLVTSASFVVYGEYIFDPVELVGRIDNVFALLLGALTFAVATLGINVVANFVSASYDLANVWPAKIDFKKGGLISAIIALLITPWNLFNNPVVVNIFLGAVGAMLGPLFGIIMADYYVMRKQRVVIGDVFRAQGYYTYKAGWNNKAIISFFITSVPTILLALIPAFRVVAPFSWFIGAALAFAAHYFISRNDTSLIESVRRATEVEDAAGDDPMDKLEAVINAGQFR